MRVRTKIMLNGIVLAVVVAFLPATALAMTEGYVRGYNDGTRDYSGKGWDASCPTGHSAAYCLNYQEGYKYGWSQAQGRGGSGGGPGIPLSTQQLPGMQQNNSTNNGGGQALEQNASNQQAPQQNVSTSAWKDFGDLSDLANIPLVGGMIASHSVATHIFHNEQGVFIPWSFLCTRGSQYLLKPCSSLVNPDGSLTSQGDTAVGCIRNGFVAAAAATTFNLPFDTIKNGLKAFAGLTGCGGIVDMDQIQNSTDLQYLLHSVGSLAK